MRIDRRSPYLQHYAKQQPKLLGTIENKLGIADMLQKGGHEFVVTDDKEGVGIATPVLRKLSLADTIVLPARLPVPKGDRGCRRSYHHAVPSWYVFPANR